MFDAALSDGRALAEARMLDTFDIEVPTGGYVYDEATGEEAEEFDLLFTTLGRLKPGAGLRAARESEAGGRTVVTTIRELHIPVECEVVPAGAVATCIAIHPMSDPTLLGARLRLAGPAPGSQTTARRLEVSEVIA